MKQRILNLNSRSLLIIAIVASGFAIGNTIYRANKMNTTLKARAIDNLELEIMRYNWDNGLPASEWPKTEDDYSWIEEQANILYAERGLKAGVNGTYVLGALLGSSIPCLLFWFLLGAQKYYRSRDLLTAKRAVQKKRDDERTEIKSSNTMGDEFTQKEESLNELKNLGLITTEEYNSKYEALIEESKKRLKREEFKKKTELMKTRLKEALENGVISQVEYDEKMKKIEGEVDEEKSYSQWRNESVEQNRFNENQCPVCKAPRSLDSIKCRSCGLVFKQ